MRAKRFSLFLLVAVLVLPNLTWSQPGGGERKRGSFDPEAMFNKFSGGKEVIVVSELDPQMQLGFQFFGQRFGLTGDRITRDQFKEAITKATAQFTQAQGGGQTGTPPTGGGSKDQPTLKIGGTGGNGPTPLVPPPTMGTPANANGPGPSGNIGERAEEFFRRRDRNMDGLLSVDEMSDELQRERETYDRNKDGFIAVDEYREWLVAITAKKDQERADRDKERDGKKDEATITPEMQQPKTTTEESRPNVFRAGKLPKDLPEWFVRLDKAGDNDGQVGLWEAKTDSKVLEEFPKHDTNNDGLITAEEVLRVKAAVAKKAEAENLARGGKSESRDNRDNRDNRDGNRDNRDNRDSQTSRDNRGPGGPPTGPGGPPSFGQGGGLGFGQGGGTPGFGQGGGFQGFGKGGDQGGGTGGGFQGFGKGGAGFQGFGKGGERPPEASKDGGGTGGTQPRFGGFQGFGKGGDQGGGTGGGFQGFGKGGDPSKSGDQGGNTPRFGGFGSKGGGSPPKKN